MIIPHITEREMWFLPSVQSHEVCRVYWHKPARLVRHADCRELRYLEQLTRMGVSGGQHDDRQLLHPGHACRPSTRHRVRTIPDAAWQSAPYAAGPNCTAAPMLR